MKTCGSCKRELPASSFAKRRDRADGLQNRCRTCCSVNRVIKIDGLNYASKREAMPHRQIVEQILSR